MNRLETVFSSTVFSAPNSVFGYHGWPSVCRGPKGELLAVCSGGRLGHVCPFGKVFLSRSFDEGRTWTAPEIVMDTPLDDRDAGISLLSDGRLLVSSFNHYIDIQSDFNSYNDYINSMRDAYFSYGKITAEDEIAFYGSTYVISDDNGKTWSDIYKAPVTAPHGPLALPDGGLLYMGNPKIYQEKESRDNAFARNVEVWYSPDLINWHKYADIDSPSEENLASCEPHIALMKDGSIVGHIRVQGKNNGKEIFCIYQTRSVDGGKTWTKAEKINDFGSPPHILLHSSGTAVCVFGHRREPFGQHAIFSSDMGESWSGDYIIADSIDGDIGYPASVELNDGNILTLYYQRPDKDSLCEIQATVWKLP